MTKFTPYVHKRRILFGDTDAAGIVYTSRFPDYCMQASEHWFRECLEIDWYDININGGMGTPVVHMELDFMASLIGGDELNVEVTVENFGNATVTLAFLGYKNTAVSGRDNPCFSARFIYCFFSKKVNGSMAIPQRQRELLERYKRNCNPEKG